jgi:hypothetical protein
MTWQVLDAIPSEQLRTMVRDALAANKKVGIKYEVTAAEVTITEPSGQAAISKLQWG